MVKIDSEKIYRGIVNVSPELVEDAEGPAAKKSRNVIRIKPRFHKAAGIAAAAALIVALGVLAVSLRPFFQKEADPPVLMSFKEPRGGAGGLLSTLESFEKRPYLEVNETTQLPETLPIYEDEFPTYQSRPQYPFEKFSKEEAEASMKKYLEIFCENTAQPVPELNNIYVTDLKPLMDQYWCDDVIERIEQMQYGDCGLGVVGSSEKTPAFYEATKDMDEELMLADPLIKSAISYQNLQNPEFKKIWKRENDESAGYRKIRIAEETDELKWNMLYEHFNSVELRSDPLGFRVSMRMPLPESPLTEACVIPYETAKEFVEKEYSCPVVYCEAAYDRDIIYPGRYLPVYRFYLEGDPGGRIGADYVFTRLVPMTDYPIPKGEEMQQYMNEAFGEYATEYYYEEEDNTSADPSLLMSFEDFSDADRDDLGDFIKRPYLEVNETTQLPETLPIYEDEFPTYQSQPQYPFEKLSREEAEASMKKYLEIFCKNTAQPVPKLNNIYVEDFGRRMDEYWCDNVNEQIEQMQYKGFSMGVLGSSEDNPDFYGATENMDEGLMLADPFIKSAVSYQNTQNPEFKKILKTKYEESCGSKWIRIAEQTDELKWDMLYEYFNSVEIRRNPSFFRVSIRMPLPESPLAEANVIPYEKAKDFIEKECSCPVVYCEAAYDRDIIYPGRYIPIYRFYLQGEAYVFTRLVPMTDYPIPKGEEMQQYMNEAFGEYATEYYYEKEEETETYADMGGKGKIY